MYVSAITDTLYVSAVTEKDIVCRALTVDYLRVCLVRRKLCEIDFFSFKHSQF